MKIYTLFFSLLLLISCSDATLKQELADTKKELATAKQALEKSSLSNSYPLVHIVYFKLKPEADQNQLIEAINKIKAIEVLHDLEIGTFEDLKDQRALSDYQVVMTMSFKNIDDYRTYQAHELHLALKETVGQFLAAPPATYDYIKSN